MLILSGSVLLQGQTGTVTDQNYPAGKQVIHYDVSNLAVGNYLYKFRSGDFTAIGKITVIR